MIEFSSLFRKSNKAYEETSEDHALKEITILRPVCNSVTKCPQRRFFASNLVAVLLRGHY